MRCDVNAVDPNHGCAISMSGLNLALAGWILNCSVLIIFCFGEMAVVIREWAE